MTRSDLIPVLLARRKAFLGWITARLSGIRARASLREKLRSFCGDCAS